MKTLARVGAACLQMYGRSAVIYASAAVFLAQQRRSGVCVCRNLCSPNESQRYGGRILLRGRGIETRSLRFVGVRER